MNWKKGIKRIVLLISITVGLGVGGYSLWWVSEYIPNKNYRLERDKTEAIDIINFWHMWEKGGFEKKEVIADMQRQTAYSIQFGNLIRINGSEFYLTPSKVFPDIDETYLNLSEDDLVRLAKIAKSKAILNANKTLDIYKSEYTPKFLFIIYVILAGLFGGAVSFLSVWIVFYVLLYFLNWIIKPPVKWIVDGFKDNEKND